MAINSRSLDPRANLLQLYLYQKCHSKASMLLSRALTTSSVPLVGQGLMRLEAFDYFIHAYNDTSSILSVYSITSGLWLGALNSYKWISQYTFTTITKIDNIYGLCVHKSRMVAS